MAIYSSTGLFKHRNHVGDDGYYVVSESSKHDLGWVGVAANAPHGKQRRPYAKLYIQIRPPRIDTQAKEKSHSRWRAAL